MQYSEFVDTIRGEINLGNIYDEQIPQKIRQAIKFMESKLDFSYMREVEDFTLPVGETQLDLSDYCSPVGLIKKVSGIRVQLDSGKYVWPQKVDPKEVYDSSVSSNGAPAGYYFNKQNFMVFDAEITTALPASLFFIKYTDAADFVDTSEHWLFENAETTLLAKTMELFAPLMREPELLNMYRAQFLSGWDELVSMVEEWDLENTEHYMEPFYGVQRK